MLEPVAQKCYVECAYYMEIVLPDQIFHTRFSSSTVTRALLVVPHIQYFHLDQNIFMNLPLLMA